MVRKMAEIENFNVNVLKKLKISWFMCTKYINFNVVKGEACKVQGARCKVKGYGVMGKVDCFI